MNPIFSIVIPTYNRPARLERCLAALSAMDYPKDRYEVLVVDDGGVVSLDELADRWSKQLDLHWLKQSNAGPGAARNTAMDRARGEFVAFTDDDCEPEPQWLSKLEETLRATPGAMAGGHTVNALEGNAYAETSQVIVDIVYDFFVTGHERPAFFASNNLAVPSPALREIGGFDPAFRTSEDRDFCDRWVNSGRELVYAPEAVVRHAHKMGFRGFVRQHFNYGRGARKFSRAVRARDAGRSSINLRFYRQLLSSAHGALKGRRDRGRIALLLVLWQVVNGVGFIYEWLFPGPVAKRDDP